MKKQIVRVKKTIISHSNFNTKILSVVVLYFFFKRAVNTEFKDKKPLSKELVLCHS